MKITNKLNLPEELVKAVKSYEPSGNYSASMLTKTPRMVWLQRRHFDETEEDVTDRIWSLFGSAVHGIINASEQKNSISEEYMKSTLDNGAVISGMADLYKDKKITDWKVVSVWSIIYLDETKLFDYESQLNTYAYLFSKYGFPVESLEIVMILRDWQKSKALYDNSYPQNQVHILPIRLWDTHETEAYLLERTSLFEQYKNTPDNDLPECSPADRWAKPSKWALMKEGRKTAIKLYDEKPDIILEDKQYLEERKADQWKRCEYCSASAFCNQYKERIE